MVWEYKIIFIGTESEDEDEYETRLHDGVHLLNELGSEGWELICYLRTGWRGIAPSIMPY